MTAGRRVVHRGDRDPPQPEARGEPPAEVSQADASLRPLARALLALAEELLSKEAER